jgi:aryl carrier-like protein
MVLGEELDGTTGAPAVPEGESSVSQRLARLWEARLLITPVGVHDDFFELGGDSIAAAELQNDIDREFGVEISATTIFLSPTIAALTEVIAGAVR